MSAFNAVEAPSKQDRENAEAGLGGHLRFVVSEVRSIDAECRWGISQGCIISVETSDSSLDLDSFISSTYKSSATQLIVNEATRIAHQIRKPVKLTWRGVKDDSNLPKHIFPW